MDAVEPTSMEWASQIVFIVKKDRIRRIFVAFCKLNAVTTGNSYPTLCMHECIDSPGD